MTIISKRLQKLALAAPAAFLALGLVVTSASGRTYIQVDVHGGGSGDRVYAEPRCNVIPGTRVECASDYEAGCLYRYDGGWYSHRGNRWLRARAQRGPWIAVEVGRVPSEVLCEDPHYRRYRADSYEDRRSRHFWKKQHHRHHHQDEDEDQD